MGGGNLLFHSNVQVVKKRRLVDTGCVMVTHIHMPHRDTNRCPLWVHGALARTFGSADDSDGDGKVSKGVQALNFPGHKMLPVV